MATPTRTAGTEATGNWFTRRIIRPIGSAAGATGRGIAAAARWTVSADSFNGRLGRSTQVAGIAAGAAGGGFLGRLGAKLAVTKTKLAEKLSPQAKRATVEGATVVGGIAGAIGLPKLLALFPRIARTAAATAARVAR